MKIKNAIKKCEKAGYVVEDLGGRFRAVLGRHVITFCQNGRSDNATAFGSTRTTAGPYDTPLFGWPSLTSIIRSHAATRAAVETAPVACEILAIANAATAEDAEPTSDDDESTFDALADALSVFATDPKLIAFLEAYDPKALKQARAALDRAKTEGNA